MGSVIPQRERPFMRLLRGEGMSVRLLYTHTSGSFHAMHNCSMEKQHLNNLSVKRLDDESFFTV